MSRTFLATLMLLFVGTTLIIWNEHRTVEESYAEIDRQNRVAQRVYHAIDRYAKTPNMVTEADAMRAMDLAAEEKLTENRQALLSNFYRNARRCHVHGLYTGSDLDCRTMSRSRMSATLAGASEDLGNPTN